MTPSRKFKRVLKKLGLTRKEFAERAQIRQELLCRIFPQRGRRQPIGGDLATLLRIVAASQGFLNLHDFEGQYRGRPIIIRDLCPLCGQDQKPDFAAPGASSPGGGQSTLELQA
jgi:hypothetical protein